MRLIDADKLILVLKRKSPISGSMKVMLAECLEEVLHAPTIEPEIIQSSRKAERMNTYFFAIPPIVSKAFEVIGGGYGTGEERKKKLEAEGYDYSKIQNCVNDVMKIFQKYGE